VEEVWREEIVEEVVESVEDEKGGCRRVKEC
jgi:hypothetical protein